MFTMLSSTGILRAPPDGWFTMDSFWCRLMEEKAVLRFFQRLEVLAISLTAVRNFLSSLCLSSTDVVEDIALDIGQVKNRLCE